MARETEQILIVDSKTLPEACNLSSYTVSFEPIYNLKSIELLHATVPNHEGGVDSTNSAFIVNLAGTDYTVNLPTGLFTDSQQLAAAIQVILNQTFRTLSVWQNAVLPFDQPFRVLASPSTGRIIIVLISFDVQNYGFQISSSPTNSADRLMGITAGSTTNSVAFDTTLSGHYPVLAGLVMPAGSVVQSVILPEKLDLYAGIDLYASLFIQLPGGALGSDVNSMVVARASAIDLDNETPCAQTAARDQTFQNLRSAFGIIPFIYGPDKPFSYFDASSNFQFLRCFAQPVARVNMIKIQWVRQSPGVDNTSRLIDFRGRHHYLVFKVKSNSTLSK